MEYKYELHCHTSGVSLCARVKPKDVVSHYEELGYSGIVLTDHYSPMTFYRNILAPQRHIEHYLSSYRELKDYCGSSFTVLLGMELRHYATVNDYLVYGVEEDWLRAQGNMLLWDEKKMCEEMHAQGFLVYQAHPFRPFITRCNPAYIDGIEIYNGHTNAEGNRRARLWAEETGKPVISGSDYHYYTDESKGGIVTEVKIENNADLLAVLRNGQYRILHGDDSDEN